jgi:hypothetical protein
MTEIQVDNLRVSPQAFQRKFSRKLKQQTNYFVKWAAISSMAVAVTLAVCLAFDLI